MLVNFFKAKMQRISTSVPKITKNCYLRDCRCVLIMTPHGHRCLSTSSCLHGKILPRKKPLVVHEIAGLEPITYADRMHFVPGLAKPKFPPWERGWKEPYHYQSPKLEDMPLYKDKPCYIFNQRTNVLEGSYSVSVPLFIYVYIYMYVCVYMWVGGWVGFGVCCVGIILYIT